MCGGLYHRCIRYEPETVRSITIKLLLIVFTVSAVAGCAAGVDAQRTLDSVCQYENIQHYKVEVDGGMADESIRASTKVRVGDRSLHALTYDMTDPNNSVYEVIIINDDATYIRSESDSGMETWKVTKLTDEQRKERQAEKQTRASETMVICTAKFDDLKYIGEEEVLGETMMKFTGLEYDIYPHQPNAYRDHEIFIDLGGKLRQVKYQETDPDAPEWTWRATLVFTEFDVENVITAPVIKDSRSNN